MFEVSVLGRIGSLNHVQLEAKNQKNPDGTPKQLFKTEMAIYADRPNKDAEGNRISDNIRAVAWNGLAQAIAKHMEVGREIYLRGHLVTSVIDKPISVACPSCKTNLKVTTKTKLFELVVTHAQFVGKAKSEGTTTAGVTVTVDRPNTAPSVAEIGLDLTDEDSPF